MPKSKSGQDIFVGPRAAGRIFGYKSGGTFIKKVLPQVSMSVRTERRLKGTYYCLRDVLRARYLQVSEKELDKLVADHQQAQRERKSTIHRQEYIGAKEAGLVFGWLSGSTFKANLPKLPPIKSRIIGKGGRRYYEIKSCFRAAYPEASDELLSDILTEYRQRRAAQRLGRRRNANTIDENETE